MGTECVTEALSLVLLKIICCGYLLESPPRGDSNRSPQHMIYGDISIFLSFNTNPRFPLFLLLYMLGANLGLLCTEMFP